MLDEKHLLNLAKKFAGTPQGKKLIKKKTGIDYDPKNDKSKHIETQKYADMMRQILHKHISQHIKSVSLDDIITEPATPDEQGNLQIFLSFRLGSMFRPSLTPDAYPEGVPNIVLHFTRGWRAKKPTRGEWHGQQVWSRQVRPGSSFMKNAIDEFNTKSKGIAVAELLADYK